MDGSADAVFFFSRRFSSQHGALATCRRGGNRLPAIAMAAHLRGMQGRLRPRWADGMPC